MKLELFTEVQSKLRSFVRQFLDIPINGNLNSKAFQHYHFNCFKALTKTVLQAMVHINYVQLKRNINNISHANAFALTFDANFQLIREYDFQFIQPEKQTIITNVVAQELKEKLQNKPKNYYSSIDFECLDRNKQLCTLNGTVFITDKGEFVVNLFYFRIMTSQEDYLLNLNFFLKDKSKHEKIYKKILETNDAYEVKLLEILYNNNLTKEEFNENIQFFFGDCLKRFKQKERFLKSLELLLFSKYSHERILEVCNLHNSPYTLNHFFDRTLNKTNTTIIRYNLS